VNEELLDRVYRRFYERLPAHAQRQLDADPMRRMSLRFGIARDYRRMKREGKVS
jgi:hypothetical protein